MAQFEDLRRGLSIGLQKERVVLLNSRQGKRPCRADSWVQATLHAVERLVAADTLFITSVGYNTWEFVLHAVNVAGGKQQILLPPGENIKTAAEAVLADFRLDPARTSFGIVEARRPKGARSDKWWWPERDRLALALADRIVAISLRPLSSFTRWVTEAPALGKQVDERFRVEYQPVQDKVGYDFTQARLNPCFFEHWDYLTHWTRSSLGRLPGESSFEFYHAICESDRYPRAAVDVLHRILDEKLLRASSRFLRAGGRAVAFTSQNPLDAVKLMRWRRRYVCYSFEPYGVAIRRDIARELGIRPVIYGPAERYATLSDMDKPYFQNQGKAGADWLPEFELRHLGDLDLKRIPGEALKVIVHSEQDRQYLPADLPSEVIALTI